MTLLSPGFLWTLLALAPLAAIYFLKVRPRKKQVTAFFLWQRVFTEKKASALFRRLRDVLSLLLMALAFAALALGLAEPELTGDERRDLLIVIDHSASMSAKDGSARLQRAKLKAADLIIGMNGTQRAAVAAFSNSTRMVQQPTRHRKALLEAVDGIWPTQLPSRVDALRALAPSDEWMNDTRVLLITDGCLDATDQLKDIEIIRIEDNAENVGIARADLRAVPGGKERLGLFLLPVSSYAKPVSTEVVLTHVDSQRIVKLIPLTLQPGTNPAVALMLDDSPSGKWTAELTQEDALPLDNKVHFYVPPREPVPVAVIAEDQFFFQNAVNAFERSDQLLTLAKDGQQARLLLGRGKPPGGASAVVFQPKGESTVWTEVGEEIAAPVPKIVAKDHPLLRYLDAENISYVGAKSLTPPAGAVVLVADESGPPLIYLTRQGEHTTCVINMDPLEAQFYLSTWFPVLIHNAAAHLTNREQMPDATLATGSSTKVPGSAETYGPMESIGFQEVKLADSSWPLAVSLVAPQESLLASDAVKTNAKPIASGQAPSYWLIVLAIGLLVSESVLYHRRKVG
jgi:hypothetical protein